MKQFHRFQAFVPENFTELMIKYWKDDEKLTRAEALGFYYDDDFIRLASRISGTQQTFKPDIGYRDKSIDGTLCFEIEDNNLVIPVSILRAENETA